TGTGRRGSGRVTEMPPRFINPICDMETPEGTTVMFECSLMGIPSPIVSWFKGDKKIPQNTKKYLRHTGSSLELLNPVKADSGEYTCKASNQHGSDSCSASLVVTGTVPVGTFLLGSACLCWGQRERIIDMFCVTVTRYGCKLLFDSDLSCFCRGLKCPQLQRSGRCQRFVPRQACMIICVQLRKSQF
uniref:Ig-like domain-containing protein n=1 Tax=Fundulus heteroclitus TaxID=8078 RepID=A0A3Q2R0H2_FUNHE